MDFQEYWWSDGRSNFGIGGKSDLWLVVPCRLSSHRLGHARYNVRLFGAETSNMQHTEGLFSDFIANAWFLIVSWGGTNSLIQLCWGWSRRITSSGMMVYALTLAI